MKLIGEASNQSNVKTRDSTVFGVNEALDGSTTCEPKLNAFSEATVEQVTTNIYLANYDRIGMLIHYLSTAFEFQIF